MRQTRETAKNDKMKKNILLQTWKPLLPSLAAEPDEDREGDASLYPPQYSPAMRSVITSAPGEVEIFPPPSRPSIPSSSIVTTLLPLLGFIIMAVVSVLVMHQMTLLIMSGAMMLVSIVGGIFSFVRERKKYRQMLDDREKKYTLYLAECSRQLENLRQQQLLSSLTPHPNPSDCLERARLNDHERRLWERTPADRDFLDLRIGLGGKSAEYKVRFSLSAQDKMDRDELARRARDLVREYSNVEGIAITVPLGASGVIGVHGDRAQLQQSGRALLMQICVNHAPNEVKLVVIFPENEKSAWDWCRWLPHIQNEDKSRRMIAAGMEDATDLLAEMSGLFSQRQADSTKRDRPTGARFEPHYVFFFADPEVIEKANESAYSKLFALLMSEGKALGASTVICQTSRHKLDRACRAVVNLKEKVCVDSSSAKPITNPFTPDEITLQLADQFARTLAPIRLRMRAKGQEKGANLARRLTFYDLLGISNANEFPISNFWLRTKPVAALEAPIGVQSEGPTIFSLQEGAEKGYGPHAVVGGMTGTGKTKGLLHTIILSLAAHNHPDDLNFLLIDYKGGDLFSGFEKLPHVVGFLGNLASTQKQSAMVRRLFICLDAELKRRRNLLGGGSINDFHRAVFTSGEKPARPLPHLVVVIDEFAELISKNPPDVVEFLKQSLLSIARTGRSYGIHLLLATQDPGNVVRGDIRDAINTIVCLGMGTREASNELLETDDAYIENLGKQLGRGYFKAKRENIYAQFQVAYSGSPVKNQAYVGALAKFNIHEIHINGKSGKLLDTDEDQADPAAAEHDDEPIVTERDAFVGWINTYADSHGVEKQPNPFMDLLPEKIDLLELRPADQGWNGQGWLGCSQILNPVAGRLDDPANLSQPVMRLNLGENGHLAVYGNDGAETSDFLVNLATSIALDHTPEEVHLYILDYEGQKFNSIRSLPHIGDIMQGGDLDHTLRLLSFLQRILKDRKQRMSEHGVTEFREYQKLSHETVPDIVLFINNYSQFDAASPYAVELLIQLMDSAAYNGIHVVISANRSNVLSRRVSNFIKLAVALQLSIDDDLTAVTGQRIPGYTMPVGIYGRGVVRASPPLEFQTAFCDFRDIAMALDQAWTGPRPPKGPSLREVVPLKDLFIDASFQDASIGNLAMPVGIRTDLLEPILLDLRKGPYFIVTGGPQSGKTVFIQTSILSLANLIHPDRLKIYFINPGSKNQRLYLLRHLAHTAVYADSEAQIEALIQSVTEEIDKRRKEFDFAIESATDLIDQENFMARYPAILLVLDDYIQTAKSIQNKVISSLDSLLRFGFGFGLYGFFGLSVKEIQSNSDSVIRLVRDCQSGALFDRGDSSNIFASQTPKTLSGIVPPGRGFLVSKGAYQNFQAAQAVCGEMNLHAWVEKINHSSMPAPTNHASVEPAEIDK